MSTLINLTRDCFQDLKMLNEYIEMTYAGIDQEWLIHKVAQAMDCIIMIENVYLASHDLESEDEDKDA